MSLSTEQAPSANDVQTVDPNVQLVAEGTVFREKAETSFIGLMKILKRRWVCLRREKSWFAGTQTSA